MKNILCFGDSNTWGYQPGTAKRYAPDVRWTGVMQRELGADYRVLEDGLNARTSAYPDPWNPWRLGTEALPIALTAQKPLDLLVLMMGTNDLKFTDAFGAAKGAEESRLFSKYYRNVAATRGVEFFDAATVAEPSTVDGIHMEPESHRALGVALAQRVKEILG